MINNIISTGRYASVEEVSRHPTTFTTTHGSFSIQKELMLPDPNSQDNQKILAQDALDVFRKSDMSEDSWNVPFLAPLGFEQRMYNIPLDLFQWPHKIVACTPNSVILPTPGCPSSMDVLIHTHNVPKYLWLELVYKKSSLPRITSRF